MQPAQWLFVLGSIFQIAGGILVLFQIYKVVGIFHPHQPRIAIWKTNVAKVIPLLKVFFRLVFHRNGTTLPPLYGISTAAVQGSAQLSLSSTAPLAAISDTDTPEIAFLKTVINQLHMSDFTLNRKLEEQSSEFKQEMLVLTNTFAETRSDLSSKLQAVALGSLVWQVVGSVLILVGIALLGIAGIISVPKVIP